MKIFHGTTTPFAHFSSQGPSPQVAGDDVLYGFARTLGTFFSESPRIAAHFVLKPEVIDAGYDSHEGSRSLCQNPWRFDPEPFEPAAQVLKCELPDNAQWHAIPLMRWMEMIADEEEAFFAGLRERCVQEGKTGVVIEAWDGQAEHPHHGRPCVEYYAPTYVVFDASPVTILEARPAAEAWDMAPEPIPGAAAPVLPAPPSMPRPRLR